MRIKLFTTEAERQRVRTRVLARFFKVMLAVLVIFAMLVAGRYAIGLW